MAGLSFCRTLYFGEQQKFILKKIILIIDCFGFIALNQLVLVFFFYLFIIDLIKLINNYLYKLTTTARSFVFILRMNIDYKTNNTSLRRFLRARALKEKRKTKKFIRKVGLERPTSTNNLKKINFESKMH